MQTPQPLPYPAAVEAWIRVHAVDPDIRAEVDRRAEAIRVLYDLDLEPARPILARCYARCPRGGQPWDPVALLRCLLLALLIGAPSINDFVPMLRGSALLRVLAGLPARVPEGGRVSPGVGTLYDFLHRLHDGPLPRSLAGYRRPSEVERAAARQPRPPGNRPSRPSKGKKGRPAPEEATAAGKPSERALAEARRARSSAIPADLLGRMTDLLWALAVRPSAERGLLGELCSLRVTGDGSPLITGASGLGRRTCRCDRKKPCDCLRTYADPDARSGWDAYRRCYFYGHHFYELSVTGQGHDLPILLRLDAANQSDHVAGLLALERATKTLRAQPEEWKIDCFIADMGHDGSATYELCGDHGIRPIIPLNGAPARHPTRDALKLSDRAVPLCQASIEMAAWGSGGPGKPAFICPVKAGKLPNCPIAPDTEPDWRCQPDTRYGPVVSVRTEDDPRLFPMIQRNSATFEELYRLRTGCERSNAIKKGRFKLEAARHRRASFWLIRLHLIAILQHALAWGVGDDPRAFVRRLMEPPLAAAG